MTVLDEIAPKETEVPVASFNRPLDRIAIVAKWLLRIVSVAVLLFVFLPAVYSDYGIERKAHEVANYKFLAFIGYPLFLPFIFSWFGRFKPAFYLLSLVFVCIVFTPFVIDRGAAPILMGYAAIYVWPIATILYMGVCAMCWGSNYEMWKLGRN